jgi:anionic cell wall polymer biosynthesis LytR-Cps2A-Psr (LCP) family protein
MKKTLSFILFLGIAGLLLFGAIYTLRWMQQPLDPPLGLTVPPELQARGPAAKGPPSKGLPDAQATNPALTCGKAGSMRLFVIGLASPLDEGHAGADAIRLVNVSFDEVKAGVLALPTDLMVDTPEDLIKNRLGEQAPLNLIYLAAWSSATGTDDVRERKATQVLAQTILDNFAFVPDKYLAVNGDPFIDLVDRLVIEEDLHGVRIYLDEQLDGTPESAGIFPAGYNDLDGWRTLDFVRILYPAGGPSPDYFGRFERQNLVLEAILSEAISSDNWTNIPDLLKDARKMVTTDLSVDQANDLACMADTVEDPLLIDVTKDDIYFDAVGNMFPVEGAIEDLVQQLNLLTLSP